LREFATCRMGDEINFMSLPLSASRARTNAAVLAPVPFDSHWSDGARMLEHTRGNGPSKCGSFIDDVLCRYGGCSAWLRVSTTLFGPANKVAVPTGLINDWMSPGIGLLAGGRSCMSCLLKLYFGSPFLAHGQRDQFLCRFADDGRSRRCLVRAGCRWRWSLQTIDVRRHHHAPLALASHFVSAPVPPRPE